MRALLLFAAAIGALVGAGCLRKTEFKCSESTQCGAGGACESTGFCSFADPDCASGRRYADYAGTTYSNQCVGGDGDIDGGVDGPPDDGPMGDGADGCPTSYSTTIGTHKYRVIATSAAWMAQRNLCAADGGNTYLASPDDQTELDAIIAAANVARVWVGISDSTEGTYATTAGGTIPDNDPMWDPSEPDNSPVSGGGQADCVSAAGGELADDSCNATYPAVCECVP